MVRVRRRGWLVALGLVCSLSAVGAAPAGGADREPGWLPVYSACVGPAIESAGFRDIRRSFAEDAVNCLFHYGITKGRTATAYDPDSSVRRWEMAVFLTRAAGPAGIVLPRRADASFDDIGGLFEEAQDAIRQMVELRVMFGSGGGLFEPDRPVSRAEMALILEGFLEESQVGPGGVDVSDVYLDDDDDQVFTDLDGVRRDVYRAIYRMFEMGVTKGRSDSRFSPEGMVTRAEMAAFITRALAHTAARPAGVTIQAAKASVVAGGSVKLSVSVRDREHLPVPRAPVDVFSARTARSAFRSGGACARDVVEQVNGGSEVCVIDRNDVTTDSSGDVQITYSPEESRTIWAWSGDIGDEYDADDGSAGFVRAAVSREAARLRVTDDMASGARFARFGDRVTFTLQLVDTRGEPAAEEDVQVTISTVDTVLPSPASSRDLTNYEVKSYETDAAGRIVLSFRHTDPNPGSDNWGDTAEVILRVTSLPSGVDLEDMTTLGQVGVSESHTEPAVVWRDTGGGAPSTLKLFQAVSYHEATDSGQGAVNRITAVLTDQYGNPIRSTKISFTSDDQDGIGADDEGDARLTRTTNRRGEAHLVYARDSGDSGVETITATGGGKTAEELVHYWVEAPGDGDIPVTGQLLHKDIINNRLVIEGADDSADADDSVDKVLLIAYDGNDHLTGLDGPVTIIGFEKDLANTGKENPPRTPVVGVRVDFYTGATGGISRIALLEDLPSDDS